MGIGYKITFGYPSGLNAVDADDARLLLRDYLMFLKHDDILTHMVMRMGITRFSVIEGVCGADILIGVAESYELKDGKGNHLTFCEYNGDEDPYVTILCSGGGKERLAKEFVAREVCLMIFAFMGDMGFNMNLITG